MKNEIIERCLIHNGKTMDIGAFEEAAGAASIYEVIRVIDGIPLFLERHLLRLEASAKLLGYSISAVEEEIRSAIRTLIRINGAPEKNIKITVYDFTSDIPQYVLGFISSSYPTDEQYALGVPAILYSAVRNNPNAKVVNTRFKEDVANALLKSGAYEALLVNEKQQLTEGSRSNLFLVKGNRVYTAPKEDVLIGITRIYLFELCKDLGIELLEQPVPVSFLQESDGLFLTGTSPKILPIRSVDQLRYNSGENGIIRRLMQAYNNQIQDYIASKK